MMSVTVLDLGVQTENDIQGRLKTDPTKRRLSFQILLKKNRNAYFLLFYLGHQMLYGTAFQHDNTRPHAAHHVTPHYTARHQQ